MTTIASDGFQGLKYGASELKAIINKNTVRAFIVTSSVLLLLLLGYVVSEIIAERMRVPIPKVRMSRVSLESLAPPPSSDDAPPPPPPTETIVNTGPAARAGTPVPVPDALLAPDAKDFANIDEVNRASSVGGDGNDNGGFADMGNGNVNVQTREAEPDVDEFIAVEKEPVFDYAALQRNVKYPDMARRNNIEGVVLIAALIGKDGKVVKTKIVDSEHELLNDAAVKAVLATSFTPAIQNGTSVMCWVRIPLRFQLR